MSAVAYFYFAETTSLGLAPSCLGERIIVRQLYHAVEVQFSRQASFDPANLPGWCLDVPRHCSRQSEHKQEGEQCLQAEPEPPI